MLDLLLSLADKSLVVTEQEHDQTRYRLLETVRQYAQDRMRESGNVERLRQLHQEFFLRLAEETEPELIGPEQINVLARLEIEHDNLRAALNYCKETENNESGLRMAGALWRFWHTYGHAAEGRQRLEEALASRGAAAQTELRAKALNGTAQFMPNYVIKQKNYTLQRIFFVLLR